MFVGHYSAGLLASRVEPTINLGILFLAAQATDLLWAMLVLLHIEHMDIVFGFTASNPFDFDHMPYSHSLAGAFLLSLLIFTFARVWFPEKPQWFSPLSFFLTGFWICSSIGQILRFSVMVSAWVSRFGIILSSEFVLRSAPFSLAVGFTFNTPRIITS